MTDATKELVTEKIEQTVEKAEEIVRHPYIKKLSQLGFYTKGFLFIVIGILAIMVAIGEKGGQLADPTGALSRVAQASYGKVILLIFIAGAFGHGAWNVLRGVADVDNAGNNFQGILKRIIAAGVGIFYFFLAWTAWSIVLTANVAVANGTVQRTFTTIVLALPFGAILIGLIGFIIIGAGVNECYSGFTGKFQENFKQYKLEGNSRNIITFLGFMSFLTRALIFALIGWFLISAAIKSNPNEAIGMDGALLTLAQSYYGQILLFIASAGLICQGVLSLYEAKYRRIC